MKIAMLFRIAAVGLLACMPWTAARGGLNYLIETYQADGSGISEYLQTEQSWDGMDPITFHRLHSFPRQGDGQILWESTSKELIYLADNESFYGEAQDYGMILDAKLPSYGDVLYQIWSINQKQLVSEFMQIRTESPWHLNDSDFKDLGTGSYVLQALVRVPDADGRIRVRKILQQRLRVYENAQTIGDGGGWSGGPNTGDGEDQDHQEKQEDDGKPGADRPEHDTPLEGNDDGFTNLKPDDQAVYLKRDATHKQIQDALDSGRDVMFPAGAVYTLDENLQIKSGGTSKNPRLIGVYGDGARPRFNVDGNGITCIGAPPKSVNHIAIVGLEFYAYKRDYTAATYDPSRDSRKDCGIRWLMPGDSIRFEDCKFSYFFINSISFLEKQEESPTNVVVHRCIFDHSWGSNDRSIGLYVDTPRTGKGIRISESTFYHNGWRAGETRSPQSHNIYLNDVYLRNNDQGSPGAPTYISGIVSIAGASHGMKDHPGGVVEDSLFTRNAIGFFVSGNDSKVRRNVVMQSTDLVGTSNDPRGFGVESFWMDHCEYEDNVVAHRDTDSAGWGLRSFSRKTVLRGNTVWNWRDWEGRCFEVTGQLLEDAGNLSNDSNESPVDPNRNLDRYAQTINLQGEQALIEEMVNRPRGVWLPQLEAREINQYIRDGFKKAKK